MSAPTFRCPRGHVWDPAEFDDDAAPADGPVACPYCGALCSSTHITPSESLPPTPVVEDPDALAAFPGYELLGVLGRGGMGVVYRARQVRTDRVVALKVPGHLDLETRVRFTTEAQAAARVSHPNIVQVYEVGEHQGRPFLALEYVPGGTLADRLAGTPLPPRDAAALVRAVARAVGAAHAHGVIHRDLKPANILLDSPPATARSPESTMLDLGTEDGGLGTPKVADFGLARRVDADTRHTRSGMILGTPDYMAPEQAAGDTHTVGPPADVWALGAILYQCLTGRPPFVGASPLDVLQYVRTLDPVPPRRLQPAVPRDLDTICLKCLHKDPDRRYPEAGELADDLKRFLNGEPVRARPVSRLERWAKRARRNPLAAGLTAGLGLVVLAAAAYGVWYHFRLQAERDRVKEQRDLAQAQRDRARHHLDISTQSIEAMLTQVAEEDLAAEPRAEQKRKALLKNALALYEELLRVEPDDPGLAWLAARAARKVGDLQRLLGQYREALVAYDHALGQLAPLQEHPPPGTDPDREVADVHNYIGEVYRLQGKPAPAAAAYDQARAIQQPHHEANPADPGYRQDLARTRYNLGIVARQQGRPGEAVAELAGAARLLEGLPANDLSVRHHRARVYGNLGVARLENGELAEADRACRQAVALFDTLIADTDGKPDFRYEWAKVVINLGLVRKKAGDPAGARAELGRARDVLEQLRNDFPWTRPYQEDLAQVYNSLVAVAFDDYNRAARAFDALAGTAGRLVSAPEAAALSGKAADVWDRLAATRGTPADHGELGVALGNRGIFLEGLDPTGARAALTRALPELLVGLRANPEDAGYRNSLHRQTRVLARLVAGPEDRTGACTLARRIAAEVPDRAYGAHRAAALLAGCVAAAERDRRTEEAGWYEGLAIQLVNAVPATDWSALRADPDCAPLMKRPKFAAAVGQ